MKNTEFYTDVLGVEYEVKFCTSKEQPKFKSLGAAEVDSPAPSDAECESSAETEADEDPSAVLYNGEEIPPFSEPGSGS